MLRRASLLLLPLLILTTAYAQSVDPSWYQELQWRCIGPFRGGRTVGLSGVPSQPNTFYIGVNNGGVWRTTDFGQTWQPIFDDQPTGSIGALAVAPSNPNVIYVGSGEGLQRPDLSTGDGIYKSTDAGKTWTHLGLRDGQQISSIIIDPRDSNRLFVAVLGHPYGPNVERGVFRSEDGGSTWQKVLYKDENTGAVALAFDPSNPSIVYADLWAARQGPWENGEWQGPGSGLHKSLDGGNTWKPLTNGLPTFAQGLGRIGIAVAPSNPNRLYAMVDANEGGVYRSDDAGATWIKVNGEGRVWGRGSDFAEVKVDPKNPDIIYVANTSTYKSTDGGKTFNAWKGAPGGDDYHTVWINPQVPQIIALASDQGATITVNGGETWSSWYNQPTAQFYHVSTDNQFPYWVYGGQQESGSAGVSSRGNDGEITFREWHPVGAEEYGYVAADPLNPNIIYGGKLSKWDRITGQVQDVSPRGDYRFIRTAPVLFSPIEPHTLYFAGNVLFKTRDGGHSWEVISPDLTREKPDVPESVGVYRAQTPTAERRGVIYAVAPSPLDINVIWAGTDDGLVHVTRDGGKTWTNVTPPDLTSWSKVSQLDASHFNIGTCYMAVNRIRLDDMRPHIYATHDFGHSWIPIVGGLPDDAPVNTVREDPVQGGLLYCGTERAVFFTVDIGKQWNPLRQNMPATSIRDLVVHGDDLVVGTHGRSFWILDDVTPLRRLPFAPLLSGAISKDPSFSGQPGGTPVILFPASPAFRYRRDTNTDTPLTPEVPAGKNPPDGAIIDYYLEKHAQQLTLEIFDSAHHLVRRYTNQDKPDPLDPKQLNVPTYWVRPFHPLLATKGHHRFIWDLYYQPTAYFPFFPISAVYKDTPPVATSPLAAPGNYIVRLTADGKQFEQALALLLDPRIKASPQAVQRQSQISLGCYELAKMLMQDQAEEAAMKGTKPQPAPRRRRGARNGAPTFDSVIGRLSGLMSTVDNADAQPTQANEQEFAELNQLANQLHQSWLKEKG